MAGSFDLAVADQDYLILEGGGSFRIDQLAGFDRDDLRRYDDGMETTDQIRQTASVHSNSDRRT